MTTDYSPYVRIAYGEELAQIPGSYRAALECDVNEFATWLAAQGERSLLTIGAGGSLPIAQMAAILHQNATGRLSRAGEPLDIFLSAPTSTHTAGLLVTASGGHSDSLAACQSLVSPPTPWAVFCGKARSRGGEYLDGSPTPVFGYDLLPEVHGWVAVNALIGQAVVLARAYVAAFPEQLGTIPADLNELLPRFGDGQSWSSITECADAMTAYVREAVSPEILVFLHGPDTKSGALDLDSKFAEAGLGHLVASEYRNFAHGRYQMMLPVVDKVGVVALNSENESRVADASVAAMPDSVPTAQIRTAGAKHGPAAEQLSALLSILLFVGSIGEVRGLQPGWGSDDTFGDLLYELDLSTVFTLPPTQFTRDAS